MLDRASSAGQIDASGRRDLLVLRPLLPRAFEAGAVDVVPSPKGSEVIAADGQLSDELVEQRVIDLGGTCCTRPSWTPPSVPCTAINGSPLLYSTTPGVNCGERAVARGLAASTSSRRSRTNAGVPCQPAISCWMLGGTRSGRCPERRTRRSWPASGWCRQGANADK